MASLKRQDTLLDKPVVRNAPWPGIVAIIAMLACLIASGVVVGIANDSPVTSWGVRPAVLLAVFTATSNVVFNTALATGIAVRFWLCASRGVKLSQLHYIWDHGGVLSFSSAVRSGPPARTVVLLALLANVLQFVGAPLLQRSSYQVIQDRYSNNTISIDLAREIPAGVFGTNNNGVVTSAERVLMPLVQHWWRNTSMTTLGREGYTCDGVCDGHVPGAGFTYHCWTTQRPLELATKKTDNQTVFLIALTNKENATTGPYLRLTSLHLSEIDNDCVGTIREETCDLESATIEYPITIQNQTVHLRREELVTGGGPRVVSRYSVAGDSPNITGKAGIGPLFTLRNFAINRITDIAQKKYREESNMSLYVSPSILADIFYVADGGNDAGPKARCRLLWTSPTEYVLANLYDFMFRSAMQLGNGTETQTFAVRRTTPTLVFQADVRYLGAGLVLTACGIGLLALLMWGWWQLERSVTLSPLETASAMGAPILQEAERDASINEILAKVRNIEFRLGSPQVETSVTEIGKE